MWRSRHSRAKIHFPGEILKREKENFFLKELEKRSILFNLGSIRGKKGRKGE